MNDFPCLALTKILKNTAFHLQPVGLIYNQTVKSILARRNIRTRPSEKRSDIIVGVRISAKFLKIHISRCRILCNIIGSIVISNQVAQKLDGHDTLAGSRPAFNDSCVLGLGRIGL